VADEAPRAENGVLFVGPWNEGPIQLVKARWPFARVTEVAPGLTRVDLSDSQRGSCPGFNDGPGLAMLSVTGGPRGLAIGFFCDGLLGAEGVRVFEGGRERDRRRVEWKSAQPPDPIAWPISATAVSLGVAIEAFTRVARPPRPALALAVEALLNGEAPATPELRHQALQLFGGMDHARVTSVLIEHLRADDWVARFHAARAYARKNRGPGQEGRPPLDALLADDDEGVRENALRGIAELLPDVEFSDRALQAQIDAAIKKGLADADDDVRAAADALKQLRTKLLG
jgi:hypothetical protein